MTTSGMLSRKKRRGAFLALLALSTLVGLLFPVYIVPFFDTDTNTAAKLPSAFEPTAPSAFDPTAPSAASKLPGGPESWLDNLPEPKNWLSCVHHMLQWNENNESSATVRNATQVVPLLVVPVMNDAKLLPRMLCSIDAPVQYFFLIQNERHPRTVELVNTFERAFSASGRVIVQRNKVNRGFAGSINQALHWALEQHSDEEVPWMLLSSADVVFGGGVVTKMVSRIAELIAPDAAMLQKLRDEVAMEERLVAEGNYSYYNAWVPAGRPLKILRTGYPGVPAGVQTSPLLPDRIRYLYAHKNAEFPRDDAPPDARVFAAHYGMVTPVDEAQGAFAVTRLMVSTVGYLDESFYPAYSEDIDLHWRMRALGFKKTFVADRMDNFPHNPYYYHVSGTNLWLDDDANPFDTEDNSSVLAYRAALVRAGEFYDKSKYGQRTGSAYHDEPIGAENEYKFFNVPFYPLDVWVLDSEHQGCFHTRQYSYVERKWKRRDKCVYDCTAIVSSGVLSEAQLTSMRCCNENGTITPM